MKNALKIFAAALVLCLMTAFVACDNIEIGVNVTPTADSTQQESGEGTDTSETTAENGENENGGGISNGGANTEEGWGAIIRPQ